MKTFSVSLLGALLAMVCATAPVAALAQEFRVGFVNTERILREANQAKSAQSRLEQEFAKREKEVQTLAAGLKSASEKFERESPTLPDSQKVTRQRQLVELDRDFQRRQREFQEDLTLRRNEEIQSMLEKANRIIKQVAEQDKFDLIIQEAVYIHPRYDITDKVLSALNGVK